MATPLPTNKKVKRVLRLQLQANAATPAPPVGTALGPLGINIVQFCKEYNERTLKMTGIVPVELTVFEDRTFTFITRTPPAYDLLRVAAGIEKGSAAPKREIVGTITNDQLREIATIKLSDLNAFNVEAAMKIVAGTARSMGLTIED